MKRSVSFLLGAAAVASLSAPAHAAPIIAPVSGTILIGGPGYGTLTETFNQAGLFSNYVSGVTDFDTYIATNPQHTSAFEGFEWFSNSDISVASVLYDFGGLVTVDKLALWNEESSGIGDLWLLSSSDGVNFSAIDLFFPTDNPLADYGPDVFGFASTSLRYARVDMYRCPQPNPGSFPACAIGEVAFRSAVPEPSTWALMILGISAAGAAMRRRRRATVHYAF